MRGATTAPICVDLETATLVHIPFEVDSVVATSGPRVYFIANSGLYVLPREGEAPRYIAHDVSDRGVRTGRFMAVGPLMIDLEMERIVGAFDGDPMFLTEDGRMLTQLHAPALARTRVADTDEVEEESGFDFESMDGMPIEMGPVTFRSALGVGAAGR